MVYIYFLTKRTREKGKRREEDKSECSEEKKKQRDCVCVLLDVKEEDEIEMKEGGKGKKISRGGCRTHTQRKKVRVEEVLAPCKKKTPPPTDRQDM